MKPLEIVFLANVPLMKPRVRGKTVLLHKGFVSIDGRHAVPYFREGPRPTKYTGQRLRWLRATRGVGRPCA